MATDILTSLNKNGSGLDIKSLTATLVQADIQPKQTAQTKRAAAADVSISALGQVRASFAKLQTTMAGIAETPGLQASSSNPAALAVTVTDRAKLTEVSGNIDVVQIAKRHVLEFGGFSGGSAPIGGGSLKVEFGVWGGETPTDFALNPDSQVHTLTIPPDATLDDLAAVLNTLGGISAKVLDKGDGTFSLGIVGNTGAGQAMRLTAVEDAAVPGLAAFDTTATNATRQVQAASDAVMVVDGITVFRSSNTVTDLVPGLQIDLTAPATNIDLTVARDGDTTYANLETLVGSINETKALLKTLSARGLDGAAAGALAGDSAIATLSQKLSSLISAPLNGFGGDPVHLADMGVQTMRDGSLLLSKYNFEKAFAANAAMFDAAFSDRMVADDLRVTVTGTPTAAAVAGNHSFVRDAVTGEASFDGLALQAGALIDGMQDYTVMNGAFAGTVMTVPEDLTATTITFGRSFQTALDGIIKDALSGTGAIARRETQENARKTEAADQLAALAKRSADLETRYLKRFAEMEKAITKMKSTGEYLSNLVDQWANASN